MPTAPDGDQPELNSTPPPALLPGGVPLLVVLSGPSGAGKDAVLAELKRREARFHFTVTATTRAPRYGERHGVDYYYLSTAEFLHLRDTDGLLEYVLYNGSYRGVPRAQVAHALRSGRDVIMRTDVRGARTIKDFAPATVLIFIYPPGLDTLRERMLSRGSESAESLRQRLALAREEFAAMQHFDYAVLNEDGCLDRAADAVQAIVAAEHCRVGRQPIGL